MWPENWDAVRLFQSMATQWRLDPMGGRDGLDYGALHWPLRTLRLHGRRARAAFAGLQVMEAAYLTAARERRRRH